jgi:NAD-dependent dihydropyrimidine dehydrogenase PreA subunit
VELKLLAKLFTTDEARVAATLNHNGYTIKEAAEINNLPDTEVKALLIGMVKKGLLDLKKDADRGLVFSLIPFVVGFYERQNGNIDKEFAELFEKYYHESFHKVMTVSPSVHRVIPIERTIPVNIDVMPYEKASNYINTAKSWGVLKCICRVQKNLIGQGCDHPVENCLVFSPRESAFDRAEGIRAIDLNEALEILAEADRAGLVHSTNNAQNDVNYICNCCSCSCGVLRGIAEYGSKDSIASSDFIAIVDAELCTGCEECLERCNFNALEIIDNISVVNVENCFGCGLCVTTCPTEAITLKEKSSENISTPPLNDSEWLKRRAKSREIQAN